MMKLRVTRANAAAFSTRQSTAGKRRGPPRLSGGEGAKRGEAVGRATSCLSISRECQTVGTAPSSISMLPACRRVVVLPHPCNTGPTGMRETGTVDRRRAVACTSRGSPQRRDMSDERSFVCSPQPAARSPPPAASGKQPCGHPHPGEDGSEPQPTTTGRCYLGVIIAGTISVHTHGSQQRSAARFDEFHLVCAGGCLEPGR